MPETWVDFIERLGLPIFIVLFLCAIVWKLLPHVIDWFKQSTESAKVVGDSIPDMKDSLHKIANDGQQKLEVIDRRTEGLERDTQAILQRLGQEPDA